MQLPQSVPNLHGNTDAHVLVHRVNHVVQTQRIACNKSTRKLQQPKRAAAVNARYQ